MLLTILTLVLIAGVVYVRIKADGYARNGLEAYIESRAPKSAADIENMIRDYEYKKKSF
jgi:hypothetical protein